MKKYFENKVLVVDEAHNLRGDSGSEAENAKGKKATACFVDVCKYVSKVLLLTGTPVVNSPLDLIPLIAMIDGKTQVSDSYFKKEVYNIRSEEPRSEFNRYFKGKIVFCYPDKEKDPNYPSRHDIPIHIPMDRVFAKRYDDLVKQAILSSVGAVDIPMIDVLRKYKLNPYKNLRPFMNGLRRGISNIKDSSGKSPKIEEVVKIAKTGQTVVYTAWLEAGVSVLKRRFDREGIKYQEITGDVDPRTRDQIKNRYNSGEFRVLIITKAGGEGLDLKGTKNIIIYEPLWNHPSTEQVIARAIRFRSHVDLPPDQRYVNVYYLRMRREPDLDEKDDTSVDSIVHFVAERKRKICEKFWKEVENVSLKAC
jgi:SNF2 family DNA or RNA helicase